MASESLKSDVLRQFLHLPLAMRDADAKLSCMRMLILMLLVLPSAALSTDRVVTPLEFEAMVLGQTLTYSVNGQVYGAEEYLEGRRVTWSFLNGDCAEGTWYSQGTQVCFAYEELPSPQCWQFYEREGQLSARYENDPLATELYELGRTTEPLACLGPDVGV